MQRESVTEEEGIVGYAGEQNFSEYNGGRKRGKRNSKKTSRRRSKKYMKKMYRGGSDEDNSSEDNKHSEESSDPNGEPSPTPEATGDMTPKSGGRRKSRKMYKGKMHKGKTRKGKVSKWITHVKNFARANKMDFRDALKNPKCKSSYHKMK